MMIAQGDVLLVQVSKKPQGLKPSKDGIILRGEATHHVHRIHRYQERADIGMGLEICTPEVREQMAQFYGDAAELLVGYCESDGDTIIEHVNDSTDQKAEHEDITLPKGTWEIRSQREYQPKQWSRVND